MLRKNYSLAEEVTVALLRPFEAGLSDKTGLVYKHPKIVENKCEMGKEPKTVPTKGIKRPCMEDKSNLVLSLEHFRHVFLFWTLLAGIACLVFFLEIILNCLNKMYHK